MSNTRSVTTLAEKTALNKRQAASALDTVNAIIAQQLSWQGPGEVLIPGMVKLNIVDKQNTPQHEGINPFTREPMSHKARAAEKVIKVRPLKTLEDPVSVS